MLGIEINPYAAELARLTVWITELQWQLRKGLAFNRRPILGRLDGIVRGDALLTPRGTERKWPAADVVVGNPPFLGGRRLRNSLGEDYVDQLFAAYAGRVPAEADLVVYWIAKTCEAIVEGSSHRAGLVATQSIRRPVNRAPLQRSWDKVEIFDACADVPWTIAGAAVRVSIVCMRFKGGGHDFTLDGATVSRINIDLTSSETNLSEASRLQENSEIAFEGTKKYGSFDIDGDLAYDFIRMPLNPNGRPNLDVVKPWINGDYFSEPGQVDHRLWMHNVSHGRGPLSKAFCAHRAISEAISNGGSIAPNSANMVEAREVSTRASAGGEQPETIYSFATCFQAPFIRLGS